MTGRTTASLQRGGAEGPQSEGTVTSPRKALWPEGVFSRRNQTMDGKGGQAGQSTGGRATEGRWQQGEEGAVGLMRAILLFLLFSC